MSEYVFYYMGNPCGKVAVTVNGLFAEFEVIAHFSINHILRSYITDGQNAVLIGVLNPTRNFYVSKRKVSLRELSANKLFIDDKLYGLALQDNFCNFNRKYKLPKQINSNVGIPQYIPPYMRANQPISLKFNNKSQYIYRWTLDKLYKYLDKEEFYNLDKQLCLISKDKNSIIIAIPIDIAQDFVLIPAFTICTPIIINGSYYAVLRILSNKKLTYLNNNMQLGKDNYKTNLKE